MNTLDTYESLARRLQVRLLDPWWSADQVYEAAMQARSQGVGAVVVRPCDLEMAHQWMAGSPTAIIATAGYPHGCSSTGTRLYELRDLLRLGAREVELTLPVARMISRQFQHVEAELQQASKSCHESGARLTVLYNSSHLGEDHKIIATKICRRTEVDTVSMDGGEAEVTLMKPLLKDVLRMSLATPAASLPEVLAAVEAGYDSITVADAAPVLAAWKAELEERARAAQPVVS